METEFVGGVDVQRSLNHSDNRCINLVPSLNDKGDIAAYYASAGLDLEATNPSGEVGSGIYTASNGRCFEVAGTTLYEVTNVAGVITLTSRGTVTSADIYRMSDNGIDLILVNGIDGWLFTFATNTLTQIKVKQADFTVTIADPAVFTSTAHTLVAGDKIRLTSTTDSILSDSILSALVPSTVASISTPFGIAVSPLNDFAYVTHNVVGGLFPYKISMFSATSEGVLSPLSPPSIALSGGLHYAQTIKLSSDGISAYVAATLISTTWNSVIDTFSVNTTTGQLTNTGYVAAGTAVASGAISPTSIVISPNDDFVYSTAAATNVIYQFSRNLGTGALTPLTPATVATQTLPQEIVISTDGLFAYCTNKTSNTISMYARNNTTGLLTALTPATISCGGLSPVGISLAPDANNPHLYVVNNGSGNVAMFSRNSTTGLLTALTQATINVGTGPQKITIPADGDSIYVASTSSNTVSMFTRDNATGLLTAASTPTIATGSTPVGITTAPDGNSVYVANSGDSTISMYSRNATADTVGLPTGLAELTTYYVIATGLTADAFQASLTAGGTAVATSGQQAGIHTFTTLGYGFPEGAKTVSYMNGRFAAIEPNTQNFFISEVLDGSWWDALNVQTVDSNPDFAIGATVAHQEYIVFCQNSGQVYYDSGAYPTPWIPNTAGIFEVGCSAPYSIVQMDNSVFWMGGNQTGDGIIWRLNGFTPMRISTISIEFAIQQMTSIDDAIAFGYQQDGHNFYVLTFPIGDRTFVYDINTGLWHERANFANGEFSRWEAQEHAFFANKHLVLDYAEGRIYSIDNNTYTYGTQARKWLRSFRVPSGSMLRVPHSKLQLDCEVGVGLITGTTDPQVMMRYSDDGGHTWSKEKWRSMGKIGEYAKRVIWYKLGITKGPPRVYELSGSDPVKVVLLNVHLD